NMIQVLKDQRVSICNQFNTCKMSVPEYRQEQRRIDDTFAFVATVTERLKSMSGPEVERVLAQLQSIRSAGARAMPGDVPQLPPPQNPADPPATPATPTPSDAQALIQSWRPGLYMLQAVGKVTAAAHKVEQSTSLGFDRDHACILGAFVQTGKMQTMWQTFNAGTAYALLGGGEDNALDVDIAIADESGKVLVSDTDDDATPIVQFKPAVAGRYEVRVGLAKSEASGSFVALAVMQDGGYTIPADRILQSFTSAMVYGANVSRKFSNGVVFHENGDWAFFGTVLEPNQSNSFGGIDVASKSIALATGDESSRDLDIEAKDGTSGQVVAFDRDKDAIPNVILPPGNYKVAVQNAQSNGPTLATLLFLDVPE
ncbi:MAG TPA: hypothetical protein VLS89_16415, partial [Candidatus Nanopelagicales bacterium]|nr:hypothetical protein [Candidatus Nanopelagicales bacterium]